ncbi:MAG: FecR domain-containing protein [Candidatus Nealsonbacteria bacterium]|nr:FecR domain-containing protein [Candidatus Nealsonbacteria bacterium]
MNTNEPSRTPADRDEKVAERNVQRLLTDAYRPEMPDPAFVEKASAAMLAAAKQRAAAPAAAPTSTAAGILLGWLVAASLLVGVGLLLGGILRHSTPGRPTRETVESTPPSPPAAPQRVIQITAPAIVPARPDGPVGSLGLVARPKPPAPAPVALALGESTETTAAERRRLALPDGSVLYLNADTAVTLDRPRHVTVHRGEVFVEVSQRTENATDDAADTRAKFVVATPDRQITALGTKFDVRVGGDGTRVVVTQGKVQVSGMELPLQAGQQLNPGPGDERPVSAARRASHVVDWTRELMASVESRLVPKSKHSGGALIIKDPNGQEANLSLRKYHVDVHIEDGFARTTIDQTYFNHLTSRLEGTFYFPLPPDASLSRLAMYVEGKLMEGGMAERTHARQVFEDIVRKQKDPALLEWIDGSTFKMRVFPLEGRQEKRIVMSYTQRLPSDYDKTEYRFPGGHNMQKVGQWSAKLRVVGGARRAYETGAIDFEKSTSDGDLVLQTQAKNVKPDRDIALTLLDEKNKKGRPSSAPQTEAQFATATHENSQYLMLRWRPELPRKEQIQRRDWIFLFEASADRDPVLARAQVEVVRGLLENAEHDDTFSILTAGTRIHEFAAKPKAATPKNVKKAIQFLDQTHLVGALDLSGAFAATAALVDAAENPVLVHIGSGVPVLGQKDVADLVRLVPEGAQYVGVGVGKRWSRTLMKSAASRSGGHYTQINPDEQVSWRAFDLLATLNAPRLTDAKVTDEAGPLEFLCYEDAMADGQTLCAIARVDRGAKLPKTVNVAARLSGKPQEWTIAVGDVAEKTDYLPRTWAKLEIDRLIALGAEENRGRIIELSKAMYVISPFTSLLVLENDAMYTQYKVDRGRKDHWALYQCPAKIEVVHEPLPTPQQQAKTTTEQPKQPKGPTAAEVLQTVMVRVPSPMLTMPGRPNRQGTMTLPVSWLYRWPLMAPRVTLYNGQQAYVVNGGMGGYGGMGAYGGGMYNTSGIEGTLIPGFNNGRIIASLTTDATFTPAWRMVLPTDSSGSMTGLQTLDTTVSVPDGGTVIIGGIERGMGWGPPELLVTGTTALHDRRTEGRNGRIRIWNTEDYDSVDFQNMVLASGATFSVNGTLALPSLHRQGYPNLWSEVNGDGVPVMWNRDGSVNSVAFSPDGRYLAGSYNSGRININTNWDAQLGTRVYPVADQLLPIRGGVDGGFYYYDEYIDRPFQVFGRRISGTEPPRNTLDVDYDRSVTVGMAAPGIFSADLDIPFGLNMLPYTNRHFTNAALGRDTQSLLMMVTPRIIIQEEDEERLRIRPPGDLPIVYPSAEVWQELTALRAEKYRSLDLASRHFNLGFGQLLNPEPSLYFNGPPRVEGRVLAVEEDGLVEIAVGTVDGLEEGHKLFVVREGEEKKSYVGNIEVVECGRYKSTAKINQAHKPVLEGDLAMTRLADREPSDERDFSAWKERVATAAARLRMRRLAIRLHTDNGHRPIMYQRPTMGDDWSIYHDLLRYAPGMNTSRADVAAVLEDELPRQDDAPATGRIDAKAHKLIDGARRAGWQTADVRGNKKAGDKQGPVLMSVDFDGTGRFRYERTTALGLREEVLCGGGSLWHVYDELGVGSRRNLNRFHRRLLAGLVPWTLPPAEELARHADLNAVGDRTVAIVPRGVEKFKDDDGKQVPYVAVHLIFASDGRLTERRTIVQPKGKTLLRETYAADGTVAWLDADDKELARRKIDLRPCGAPRLHPDTGKLVILPMPMRSRHVDPAGCAQWSEDEALEKLAGAMATNLQAARQIIAERFFDRGDRRTGFYTLMITDGHVWNPQDQQTFGNVQVKCDPAADHPEHPLATYIAAYLHMRQGDERAAGLAPAPGEGFLSQLTEFRDLQTAIQNGCLKNTDKAKQREYHDRLLALLDRCKSPGLAWALLSAAMDSGNVDPFYQRRLGMKYRDLRNTPGLSYVARYEYARTMWQCRDAPAARKAFTELHADAIKAGMLPPIDADFRKAFTTDGRQEDWRKLMRDAAKQMIDKQARPAAVRLAWQARHVGDPELAAELFRTVMAGCSRREQLPTTLAAVEYFWHTGQHDKAGAVLQPLLDDEKHARWPVLWRLAAMVAEKREMSAQALRYVERAMELEYEKLPESVDVRRVRLQYADLLNRYEKLAKTIATLHDEPPREFLAGAIRAADRWRSLDTDPTAACRAAARVFADLGAADLAWDYLTTPLAAKPNEAAPWLDLAETLRQQAHFDLADRAYASAFEAEPGNAKILWDRAQVFLETGRHEPANKLMRQLADGDWGPEYDGLKARAAQQVGGK